MTKIISFILSLLLMVSFVIGCGQKAEMPKREARERIPKPAPSESPEKPSEAPASSPEPAPAPPPSTSEKPISLPKILSRPSEAEPSSQHPSAVQIVDQALNEAELGNIAFNSPQTMNLDEKTLIELYLSLKEKIEDLKGRITATGEREGASIRVSERMEAKLSGSGFSITPITPELQSISGNDLTVWKWEVKAVSEGVQDLHLVINMVFSVNGKDMPPRTMKVFDRRIQVKVSSWYKIKTILDAKWWDWIWAAILLPIIGFAWKWFSRKRKGSKKKGMS